MNKLKTIVAAMLLTGAVGTASAIGTYEYQNFTTSLDGQVGATSSYEFRGITLNDQPTVYAQLQLIGIDGTLKGFYIGAGGIGTNGVDNGVEFDYYLGWKTIAATGWQSDIGVIGKSFTRQNWDAVTTLGGITYDANMDYGELYGNLGYTWDTDYVPNLGFGVSWSPDYYNQFGDMVYYDIKGSFSVPTNYNPVKFYAGAGYSDSQDNGDLYMSDYGDYKVGISTKWGEMNTDLSVTWIDSKDDFAILPTGSIDSGDNATANLTLSYNF